MKENNPLVSIIIPTFNSEKTLYPCLESIRNQTYKNVEIIVIDKFSKDNTINIAKAFTNKVFQIKAKERSEQINFGVRKANGKYIYRVDSDFILEPTVIEEAVNKCEREGFDAIVIHNTSDPNISFWSKIRKFERDFYKNDKINVAARFIKKNVFVAIGGYDEELVAAEDYDLHNRLLNAKYKIGYINAREIHIGEPGKLSDIVIKHYYYGKTIKRFIKKHKARGLMQLSPIRMAFLRKWRIFLSDPLLFVGFILYQFIRYFSAFLGFLSSIIND